MRELLGDPDHLVSEDPLACKRRLAALLAPVVVPAVVVSTATCSRRQARRQISGAKVLTRKEGSVCAAELQAGRASICAHGARASTRRSTPSRQLLES